jgi:hypothetical protein
VRNGGVQLVQLKNQASLHVPAVLLRSSANFVTLLVRTPTRPPAHSCPTYRVRVRVSHPVEIIFVTQNVLSKLPVNSVIV